LTVLLVNFPIKKSSLIVALFVQWLSFFPAAGQPETVRVSGLEEVIAKYTVEVPVRKPNDDHRLTVEAEVDGTKVCMVVDSGADTIIVDETVAKDKKLDLRKVGTAIHLQGVQNFNPRFGNGNRG
jgi:hypothetical protein